MNHRRPHPPLGIALALTVVPLILPLPAAAERPLRELRDTLGASVNLPGVQNTLDLSWRWPLSRSSSPLLRDAHLSLGLTHTVSPSYNRLGGWLELSPLSILDLRAGIEPGFYHGFAGSLLGFDSRDERYDQDRRRELGSLAVLRSGVRAYVAPTLKARWRRLVGTAGLELEWWRSDADAAYYYEPSRDTLLASDGDRVVRTTVVVGHESQGTGGRRLLLGLNHRLTHVPDADAARIDRPGILAAWTLGERRLGVGEPTVVLNLFYYRRDPYKQGELGLAGGLRFLIGPRDRTASPR
jgi:hypothetical protein